MVSLAHLGRSYCFKHNFCVFKVCITLPEGFTDYLSALYCVIFGSIFLKSKYRPFNSVLAADMTEIKMLCQ